jgi:hypothetical protein
VSGAGQENRSSELQVRLRAAVSDGYVLVKGLSLSESLASATPEQLMSELLIDLVGPSPNPRRLPQLERVRNVRAQLRSAIEQIRSMPPEALAASSAADAESSALTAEESSASSST